MPWIIISANGEEIDRRELGGPLIIGRSPECDVAVRDLLLSRTHCRLEPAGQGWKVVDLNSRNGTRVGWQEVQAQVLRDGDHLRMGRTRVIFYTGEFEPAPYREPRPNRIIRPADPHEALTGTVTDYILLDEEETPAVEIDYGNRPYPQPRAVDPVLSELGGAFESDPPSSPWVSSDCAGEPVEATALLTPPRAVMRALPRLPLQTIYRQIKQRGEEESLALQADPHLGEVESVGPCVNIRRRRQFLKVAGLAFAAAVGTTIVVMSIWLLTLAP